MAISTTSRLFVAYAPDGRVTTSEHKSGNEGAAATAGAAPAPSHRPVSSRSEVEHDSRDATVTAPSVAKQVSADVLVVDDDADVRWTVAEVLRSAGLSVAEAQDGEIALGLLGTNHYRMVLLDIRMPKRDGVSLIESVGDVPPVVVHSAYALDAAERQRLGDRVVDYLHKPVSPQKLLRAVEAVLGTGHGT